MGIIAGLISGLAMKVMPEKTGVFKPDFTKFTREDGQHLGFEKSESVFS